MLDRKFQQSLDDQAEWPPLPLAHPENLRLYMDFHTRITHEMYNVTCGSCGCIFHSFDDMDELRIDDPALKLLSVPRDLVPLIFQQVSIFWMKIILWLMQKLYLTMKKQIGWLLT